MVAKLTKEVVNQRLDSRGIRLIGEYTTTRIKALFQCSENHQWLATPGSVIRGQGCPYCANRPPLSKEIVNERLADRGIVLVGDYVNIGAKALFRCSEGHEWSTLPGSVMKGVGCPYCSGKAKLSKEIVNERIADRGISLVGEYTGSLIKALFQCSQGHQWMSKPNHIMSGNGGCPTCAKYGFNKSKPAIMYYIRFDTDYGPLWKIGITNRTPEERFVAEKTPFEVIKQWQFDDGFEALNRETEILSTFKRHKYSGPQVLRRGNTECFVEDVLLLDKAA